MVDPARFVVDARDPRAPSQEVWDSLDEVERARIVASLPSEFSWAAPPEGDPHGNVREAPDEHLRRIRRDVYLSCKLALEGRRRSAMLDLELALDEAGLRFFHGSAPLPDARELIGRLSSMVDAAVGRAEEEARRAEAEAGRAEAETQRAEALAAKLRALGVDPDA